MDTKTKYLGLELKSPIIVGSCGLTSDVAKMVEMEKAGAGATPMWWLPPTVMATAMSTSPPMWLTILLANISR